MYCNAGQAITLNCAILLVIGSMLNQQQCSNLYSIGRHHDTCAQCLHKKTIKLFRSNSGTSTTTSTLQTTATLTTIATLALTTATRQTTTSMTNPIAATISTAAMQMTKNTHTIVGNNNYNNSNSVVFSSYDFGDPDVETQFKYLGSFLHEKFAGPMTAIQVCKCHKKLSITTLCRNRPHLLGKTC